MSVVTVDDMKNYLRVDADDDDSLIESLITGAEKTCMDVARIDDEDEFAKVENAEIAFTCRWCKLLSAVETTGYRIVMDDDIYNIVSVNHQNNKKKTLKFFCEKVRR